MFLGFPMEHLTLNVAPARVMPGGNVERPDDALNGVPALTNAEPAHDVIYAGVTQPSVLIPNITEDQLFALGFVRRHTQPGTLTGRIFDLPLGPMGALVATIFGEYMDLDGSGSNESMRILVAGQNEPIAAPYLPPSTAWQMLEDGGFLPLQEPPPPAPPPPPAAQVPQGVPVQMGNVHVHFDDAGHGVAQHPPGDAQPPAPPGAEPPQPPAEPQAPPAAGQGRNVHWGDVRFPAMQPPPGNVPPMPPPAPPPNASAGLWQQAVVGATPNLDFLFAQATPAMLADLDQLDVLVRMLGPDTGSVPPDAFLPHQDPTSRFAYIEEVIEGMLAYDGVVLPPMRFPGWQGIVDVARALKRAYRAASASAPHVNAPVHLPPVRDVSWGQMADRHRLAQRVNETVQSGVSLDPSVAAAVQAAGVAVDQEGLNAARGVANPMLDGVQAAAAIDASGSLASVRGLGDRMANFDQNVQILEATDGANYAATSSAHMTAVSLTLKSLSLNFAREAAERLRAAVGIENQLTWEPERQAVLQQCVKDLFRGKPLLLSEKALSGRGADSLVFSLTEAGYQQWRTVMEWMDFAVQLFDAGAAREAGFFGKAREIVNVMHEQQHVSFEVLSQFLDHRLRAIQQAFRQFYTNQRLVRPRYVESWLTDAEAKQVLEQIKHDRLNLCLQRAEAREAAAGASTSNVANVSSDDDEAAAAKKAKRKRQREKTKATKKAKAAAASAAAAAAAPAPANLDVIGGPPHVGAATVAQMAAFTAANVDSDGNGLCFNRWRRGLCRKGDDCTFSHHPKAP
jgi:hypothetical protein